MRNNFFLSGLCLLTASQNLEAKDNKLENVNTLFPQHYNLIFFIST